MLNNKRRGLLIILSSPSGAGKSTLSRRLMKWDPSLSFSVSSTTRSMRSGEENGRDYFFVSEEEFSKQVADGEMLEHAQVFDCSYGSPKKPVENAINHGEDVLFDIDWQGAQQISNSALQEHVLSIFISTTFHQWSCSGGLKGAVKIRPRSSDKEDAEKLG